MFQLRPDHLHYDGQPRTEQLNALNAQVFEKSPMTATIWDALIDLIPLTKSEAAHFGPPPAKCAT